MSASFDGSPVMLFASVAGLLVYCEPVIAIPVVLATSKQDENYLEVNDLAFPWQG